MKSQASLSIIRLVMITVNAKGERHGNQSKLIRAQMSFEWHHFHRLTSDELS